MPKVSCLSLEEVHGAKGGTPHEEKERNKRSFPLAQSNLSLRYDWRAKKCRYRTEWEFDAKIILKFLFVGMEQEQ